MRNLLFIITLAILFGCVFNASAQVRTDSSEVMKQLLAAPAPTPHSTEVVKEPKLRSPKFFDRNNPPPDDAPLEDLFAYWSGRNDIGPKGGPSAAVKQRLLDASLNDLQELSRLLSFFQPSDGFAEKIKQAFDSGQNTQEDAYARQEIRKWLVFNSNYFLGELLSLANKVKDVDKDGFIENESALVALAKVDWSTAQPLLQTLADTGPRRTSTLALTLLYQHSIDEKDSAAELKFRSRLQEVASNTGYPGRARDTAIEALSLSEWSGRDDWYLSLLSDESLTVVSDGNYGFSPLGTVFNRDPDKWIPIMTKIVAGKDRIRQQNAASCLVRYANAYPRRDVILPVLRWLTEPDWIPISGTERTWFMQKMDDADVPESIPGLIWIVENDESDRGWAADTLAHYKDPRAIPALKKALKESKDPDRTLIFNGLFASGGLTEPEQLSAIEAYAVMRTTASGREEVERYRSYGDKPLPLPVDLGQYLATLKTAPDTLVRSVIARAGSLRKSNAPVSQSLLEIAHQWQGRQIDLDVIRRIAANTAEASTIITALDRRVTLRESVPDELHSLLATSGEPQGVGAILLENDAMAASILSSANQAAQIAVLACARLTQTPLPVDLVGPLLQSKNSLLAVAAERYLLVEDSKEARTLLWQHHPNEAFVTGWRENIPLIGGYDLVQMGKLEEKLRAELLKPDGPSEIFALIADDENYGQILRIYADKAVYTHYEDPSRYRERVVPAAEIANFRQFISQNGIADLGPQFGSCHHNCWLREFLMLNREAGRRVFSHQAVRGTMLTVLENFNLLGHGEGSRTHYHFEKEIKGLEVLFADGTLEVKDVWQRGDEIRIFVQRPETEEAVPNTMGDEDENTRAEAQLREVTRLNARFSWRTLKDKDAGSITTAPDGYTTFDETRFPLDELDDSGHRDERQVQVLNADSILLARGFEGLWKQVAGAKAVRISGENEAYAGPIVTPDGKWAVVAKTDSDWSKPNYLVRLNLQTGRESRVKLEPADQLDAIAFLPLHGKVLVFRAKADFDPSSERQVGLTDPEYYLIDPKTGAVQPVSGEFEPLHHRGKRFLQPTGTPDEYWAAIPDADKDQTQVGRYNLKDFSFKSVMIVPRISFDSMAMWVDEKQGKLYLVYKNQLVSLPLKNAP